MVWCDTKQDVARNNLRVQYLLRHSVCPVTVYYNFLDEGLWKAPRTIKYEKSSIHEDKFPVFLQTFTGVLWLSVSGSKHELKAVDTSIPAQHMNCHQYCIGLGTNFIGFRLAYQLQITKTKHYSSFFLLCVLFGSHTHSQDQNCKKSSHELIIDNDNVIWNSQFVT